MAPASAPRRPPALCKEAVTISGAPPDAVKGEGDKGRGSGGTGEPRLTLSSHPIITKPEPGWPPLEPACPLPAQPGVGYLPGAPRWGVSCHPSYLRRSLKGTRQWEPPSWGGVCPLGARSRLSSRQEPRPSSGQVRPALHSLCAAGECPINEWAPTASKGTRGSKHPLIR